MARASRIIASSASGGPGRVKGRLGAKAMSQMRGSGFRKTLGRVWGAHDDEHRSPPYRISSVILPVAGCSIRITR
jgi:hypothetical protein